MGSIAVFCSGAMVGALVWCNDFTVTKGDFTFSTNGNNHAMLLLQLDCKDRIEELREKANQYYMQYESQETTPAAKQEIVKEAILHYLAPATRDHLLGHDVVLFHANGKLNILKRQDFDEIQDHWARVLASAGVKHCVDTLRIGSGNESKFRKACTDCLKKQ